MNHNRLIKDYKNNNVIDLEKIVNDYNCYIHKVIYNMNFYKLTAEDIEEIVSDTFFIIWNNRDKLDEDKILSSYLAGIARNLVRDEREEIKDRL